MSAKCVVFSFGREYRVPNTPQKGEDGYSVRFPAKARAQNETFCDQTDTSQEAKYLDRER